MKVGVGFQHMLKNAWKLKWWGMDDNIISTQQDDLYIWLTSWSLFNRILLITHVNYSMYNCRQSCMESIMSFQVVSTECVEGTFMQIATYCTKMRKWNYFGIVWRHTMKQTCKLHFKLSWKNVTFINKGWWWLYSLRFQKFL